MPVLVRNGIAAMPPVSRRPAGRPLVVLTGTTASGKNRVGALLGAAFDGEVISLDSMKVYRGMDVGTDKPDAALRERVPHHMVDILDPADGMNLRRYVDLAQEAREGIRHRGRLPIAVGGTALYLTGFLYGVFNGPGADQGFRRGLRAEAAVLGVAQLHERLREVDAAAAGRIHPNDYKRIERALEVFALTGKPISSMQGQWAGPPLDDCRLYVLIWSRETLDRRIEERVDAMFDRGLVEEVASIRARGGFGPQAAQALGYREILAHLDGEITLSEAAELIKRGTRRYARRQLTWFRSMKEAEWLEALPGDTPEDLAGRIQDHYERSLPC